MIVENLFRNWTALMVQDELVENEGLGLAVGRCLGMFYAGNGMVVSRDTKWLQGALFRRYRLVANIAKSKAMVCQPRKILYEMTEVPLG